MKLKWWLAWIGYLGLAIIMTWPLIFNLTSHIMGAGGDAPMFLWNAWWIKQALFEGQSLFTTNYMFWPQTINLTFHTLTLVNSTIIALLSELMNLILAFNLYFLISISLSGLFTFFLVRHITKSDLPAFVSGIIFAFAPYITMHWLGHQNLTTVWFIPLFVLLIIKLTEEKKWLYAILAGVVAGLASLNDFYNPVFLFGFLIIWLLWLCFSNKRKLICQLWAKFCLMIFIWVGVWSIWLIPAINNLMQNQAKDVMSLEQIVAFYSADLLRYFIPSFLNPILGWLASVVPGRFSGGVEGTIFVGYTTLILIVGFLIYKLWHKLKNPIFPSVWFWVVLVAVAGILSLGPYLKIAERVIFIPLPYAWIYELMPLWGNFRVPARFSLMVMLGLAVLAGIALSYILTRIKKIYIKRIVICLIILLVTIEFIPAPYPLMDLSIPPVYEYIKNDEISESLLEIPWGINSGYWDEGKFISKFAYFGTYHNKKLAIGSISRAKSEYFEFFPEDKMPFAVNSPEISDFGYQWSCDWVVIHKNYLSQSDLEGFIQYFDNLGFTKTYEDSLNIAYRKR